MARLTLNVNGKSRDVEAEDDSLLLYVLRNQLGLNGPKFGCGLAQCGACTVLVNGRATRSCLMPLSRVAGAEIVTLEGLGSEEAPGPVQRAFIEEQAVQCGYCINGMIMTATAFLAQHPEPTEEEVRQALAANLCRCGTHTRIIRAVMRAASEGGTS